MRLCDTLTSLKLRKPAKETKIPGVYFLFNIFSVCFAEMGVCVDMRDITVLYNQLDYCKLMCVCVFCSKTVEMATVWLRQSVC